MRPGFARASAKSSCNDDIGMVEVATRSIGSVAMRPTGAKAFTPSKGSFEYSPVRAANAGVANSSV